IALAATDINQQLNRLFYPGLVFMTPRQWFDEYPRYLQAIGQRLEKAALNPQKDRVLMAELEPHEARLAAYLVAQGEYVLHENAALSQYRWALEEFRVSLFAQTLKTRF